jgi:hypothetical protein
MPKTRGEWDGLLGLLGVTALLLALTGWQTWSKAPRPGA